jgi:isocitrate/isopropylmalate dehydrogenase
MAHRVTLIPGDGVGPELSEATLAETRQIGDVVLLRYALSDRFDPSACPAAAEGNGAHTSAIEGRDLRPAHLP